VVDYWRRAICNDLKRDGREVSAEKVEKYLVERNYGKAYSGHYTQRFVDATNRKLTDYLKKEKLLKG
jgi:hypothetical protein